MLQCRFCGTYNEASALHCMTCDTVLAEDTSPGLQQQTGDATRSLMPSVDPQVQAHPSSPYVSGGPAQGFTASYPSDNVDVTERVGQGVAAQAIAAAYQQPSPHLETSAYVSPEEPIPSPDNGHTGDALVSQEAMQAFDAAPSAKPPVDEGYQVDFGGFDDVKGPGARYQSLMVLAGLSLLGLLVFVGVMIFSDSSDDDSQMAARKAPSRETPEAKAREQLKLAQTHIDQERWKQAKATLDEVGADAPDGLQSEIQALRKKLKREKAASDWFRYAHEKEKKGQWSLAHAALKKIDPGTRLSQKAQLLEKRIREQRIPKAMRRGQYYARRRRYQKSYITFLKIERVAPKTRGLAKRKRYVARKLRRYLYKRKRRCRRFCYRRYRRRRLRKRRKPCLERCTTKYKMPTLPPLQLAAAAATKDPAPRPVARPVSAPPAKLTRKQRCAKRCQRSLTRMNKCQKRCTSYRIRRCKRYYQRRYRRSRRRRNAMIRKKCIAKRYLRYCQRNRSRRACRFSYRRLRRCMRRCR